MTSIRTINIKHTKLEIHGELQEIFWYNFCGLESLTKKTLAIFFLNLQLETDLFFNSKNSFGDQRAEYALPKCWIMMS